MRSKEESIAVFRELEESVKNDPLEIRNRTIEATGWEDFILQFINLNGDDDQVYPQSITCTPEGDDITQYNKRRSLGDLYRLVSNYYPEVDIIDLAKYLTQLSEEGVISAHICPQISKMVFPSKNQRNNLSMSDGYDYHNGDFTLEGARSTNDNLYHDDYLNLLN